MAEKIGSVWAIDIGNTSLKALRLSNESGALEVTGFDHILHQKVLAGSGIKDQEKQELIAISLRQFVQANDLGRDEIWMMPIASGIIGTKSHSLSLTSFC